MLHRNEPEDIIVSEISQSRKHESSRTHSYEVPTVKFTETKRMVVVRPGRRRNGELVFNACGASVEEEGKVLEMDKAGLLMICFIYTFSYPEAPYTT